MASDRGRFKVAFPLIRLPEKYGGRWAIVLFSMGRPLDLQCFATCIDETGQVHQNVPLSMAEMKAATDAHIKLLEVEDIEAPRVAGLG